MRRSVARVSSLFGIPVPVGGKERVVQQPFSAPRCQRFPSCVPVLAGDPARTISGEPLGHEHPAGQDRAVLHPLGRLVLGMRAGFLDRVGEGYGGLHTPPPNPAPESNIFPAASAAISASPCRNSASFSAS